MQNTLHLILGDCLFPSHDDLFQEAEGNQVLMAEDYGLCTHFRYHKHKITFFLSAMRLHAKSLEVKQKVTYYPLEDVQGQLDSRSFEAKLNDFLNGHPQFGTLRLYEVDDRFFEERLIQWSKSRSIKLEWVQSPKFLFSLADFKDYLNQTRKPFLKTYYERQRKALNILLDDQGKPVGGQWSYDAENRKKMPKTVVEPLPLSFSEPAELKEVKALVERQFSDHPGQCSQFRWAVNREQALMVLNQFIEEKIELFGPYEDAFEAEMKFGFHSTLSPYLNNGLLTPSEVLQPILDSYHKDQAHLPSVEGFVRQVLGWREFIRGMYRNFDFDGNHFQLQRKLSRHWYEGNTGIPPLDDSIKKVLAEGYNHHIERLMVLGNLMLLCEIHPQEVYAWFMEMYVDSADWVMVPNVLGMSQFADGGLFATKPYIAGSNYLRKMSHYPKGDWCDTVDGLYWRFIEKHQETFARNPRMSMMVATLRKMNPERKTIIFGAAESFLKKIKA